MKTIKKPRRRSWAALSEEQAEYLLFGDFIDYSDSSQQAEIVHQVGQYQLREWIPFHTTGERRKAWESNRAVLMAKSDPGSRPFAWWLFDAPADLRRQLSGPACLNLETAQGDQYFSFCPGRERAWGLPVCWESFEVWKLVTFESEAEYLRRHGLLTETEEEALNAQA